MIIEKINALCIQNGTNLTALCKEITGSSGNLPTWKKDRIRPEWLRQICLKFNISSDYLLELQNEATTHADLSIYEQDVLLRFKRLNPDYQIKTLSYMIDLYEKQEANNLCNSNMTLLTKEVDEESVAADEPLRKTGTDNLGK